MCTTDKTRLLRMVKQWNNETADLHPWHVDYLVMSLFVYSIIAILKHVF